MLLQHFLEKFKFFVVKLEIVQKSTTFHKREPFERIPIPKTQANLVQ
jgi:hypothetical protein